MNILIVSGFLGAGKTTFIKELIRRTGKQPVILENEYGENDLDSRDLKKVGDLEIMEFMEGCICCSKKDTFANTILAISASLDPEYLIVEPSGVGKLSNIIANVQKVSYDKIRLLPPVVILTPRSIESYRNSYPEIYLDQVRHAGHIVFSKIEHEDPLVLAEATDSLREINASSTICNTPYQKMDDDWFERFFEDAKEQIPEVKKGRLVRRDKIEIEQLTLREGAFYNPAHLIVFLEDLLRGRYGNIVRAKGVARAGSIWVRYDLADELYAVIEEANENAVTQHFFAGTDIDRTGLKNTFHI